MQIFARSTRAIQRATQHCSAKASPPVELRVSLAWPTAEVPSYNCGRLGTPSSGASAVAGSDRLLFFFFFSRTLLTWRRTRREMGASGGECPSGELRPQGELLQSFAPRSQEVIDTKPLRRRASRNEQAQNKDVAKGKPKASNVPPLSAAQQEADADSNERPNLRVSCNVRVSLKCFGASRPDGVFHSAAAPA